MESQLKVYHKCNRKKMRLLAPTNVKIKPTPLTETMCFCDKDEVFDTAFFMPCSPLSSFSQSCSLKLCTLSLFSVCLICVKEGLSALCKVESASEWGSERVAVKRVWECCQGE